MLFTCTPRASAATRPASRKVVKRGNKSLAVDLHCHVHTPAADELAKKTDTPAADPMARYGNPLDTTFALSHIIFGGVLERRPGLKFVAAHGGGYLGHYPARMDRAYKVRPECHDHIKRPPTWYLKKVYFVNSAQTLTRVQKDAIIGGNAAKRLKIKSRNA